MERLESIPIRTLYTEQTKLHGNTVRDYCRAIVEGEPVDPVNVSICHISGNQHLINGNHRCTAHLMNEKEEVLAKIAPCSLTDCKSSHDHCAEVSFLFSEVFKDPLHIKERKKKRRK